MKLAEFLLTPPIAAISVFLSVTLGAQARDVTFTTADDIATLQSVIDGLESGDRVLLGVGTYSPNYTIVISNGVTLVGSHYTNCVIRPASGRRVIEITKDSAGGLQGLTVTGGRRYAQWDHCAGIYMEVGTVSHCMVSNNLATGGNQQRGGGVMCMGGTVTHTVITGNKAGRDAGGLIIGTYAKNPTGDVLVDRCLISGNTSAVNSADGIAGGVCIVGVSSKKSVTLRNCTIVGNTTEKGGGGLNLGGVSGTLRIESCILDGNVQKTASTAAGYPEWSGTSNDNHWSCCLIGGKAAALGVGSFNGDPGFKKASAGDYHLSGSSQAIDKGDAASDYTDDLDGVPVTDGKPDIGCYEFNPEAEPFSATVSYSADTTFPGAKLTYAIKPVHPPKDKTLTYLLTVTDGTHTNTATETEGCIVLNETGIYTVNLKTYADGELVYDFDGEATVPIYPPHVHIAATDDVAEILNGLHDGQTASIDEGEFTVTATINLKSKVTVTGAGIDRTILRFVQGERYFYLNNVSAVVSGLTIRGIRRTEDSCVTVTGTLRDARVTQCKVTGAKYNGSSLRAADGGKIDSCIIDRCTNTTTLGQVPWVYPRGVVNLLGGRLRNSLVTLNVSDSEAIVSAGSNDGTSGLLENCTVVSNEMTAARCEALAVMVLGNGKVYNCLVANNSAPNWTETSGWGGMTGNRCYPPNWGLRNDQSPQSANFANNCWGESAESLGANCADGAKILFKDPANGNWRFGALSSCYDAGKLDATWMTGATDLDGNPRVFHRNRVDIGCYECQDTKGLMIQVR